jgi:uncharacterized protein (TIGR03083 family)
MTERIEALRRSSARLHGIVEPLSTAQLRTPAYPSDWSVADVLSHIGSGAVIMQRRIEAAVAGEDLTGDFAPGVWEEWDAKTPTEKAADGLAADRTLLGYVDGLSDDERSRITIDLGPIEVDLDELLGLRVNEHALHTWDIEVTFDPTATIPRDEVALIVDNMAMIAGFTAKPTGLRHDVHVHTTDPERSFVIAFGETSVALTPCLDADCAPELELPAEAFVRLVYGRLDPAHTPPGRGTADLDELRRAFPGV